MKSIIPLCASLLLITTANQIQAAENATTTAKNDSAVVAVVNDEEITEQEVLEQIDKMLVAAGQPLPEQVKANARAKLYQQALDQMVTLMLLKEEAAKHKVTVSEEEVDEQLNELKANTPTEEQFIQALQMSGFTLESLKEEIRERLVLTKVIDAQSEALNPVTEEEIKSFYEENKDQMKQEETVEASHILLRSAPNATDEEKEEVKKQLQTIREEIVGNKMTFEEAAKKHSEDPGSGQQGGDLGEFTRGQMVPQFEQVAFALKPGEISEVFDTQFGYHIIKVDEHNEAKEMTLEEARPRIEEFLELQSKQEYLKKLKEDAKIETKMTQEQWQAKYQPEQPPQPQQGTKIQINPEELKQN